tara:strand:+ start:117 stop:413 length:297 start_codon:yes stop_codon:yes gene_type:complete
MEYIIIALVGLAVLYTFFNSKSDPKPPVKKTKPSKVQSRRQMGPGPGARNRKKKSAPSVAELKKLTKVQLLEHADKNNIKVKRSGSKAEVVKAIASHK